MHDTDSVQRSPRRRSGGSRRWIWITLGVIGALAITVAIALPRLLDPERYRGHIEQALTDATGWNAELGAIDLSVLRGLALTVSPASLRAEGDGSQVEIDRIAIRASLLPLLRGELNVQRIDLLRPEIRLVRRSLEQGWELPQLLAAPDEPATAGASDGIQVAIERFRVDGGRLTLEDRSIEPTRVFGLEELALEITPADGRLEGSGELVDGGSLEFGGSIGDTLTLDLDGVPTDRFSPLVGAGLLHPGGAVSGRIEATFPGRVAGTLSGERILLLDGERPFESVEAEFELLGGLGTWRMESFKLVADGATIEGSGPLLPNVALDLRLTPTPLETALHVSEAVIPIPLEVEPPGEVSAAIRVDRPAGGELTYEGGGEISAARLDIGDLLPDARDVRAEFDLDRQGSLEVRVVEGIVGGGPLRGTALLDSLVPPGNLSFDGGLQDAVLGELLGGLVHEAIQRVAGPTALDAQMTLNLAAEALDVRAIGGRLELDSRQVNLPGWDLEGALRRGIQEKAGALSGIDALLNKHLGGGSDEAETTGSTDAASPVEALLDRLGATVDFDRYPWGLDRVEIGAGDIDADGAGTFDPLAGTVDLAFTARLSKEKTAEMVRGTRELRVLVGGDGRLAVPLQLSGPLLRPSVSVDLGDALSEGLGQELEEEKDKAIEGLLKGLLDRD